MEFNVGDRVKVATKRWDAPGHKQHGLTGTITRAAADDGDVEELNISVCFDVPDEKGYKDNGYHSTDLELLEPINPHEGADQYYMAVTGEDCG